MSWWTFLKTGLKILVVLIIGAVIFTVVSFILGLFGLVGSIIAFIIAIPLILIIDGYIAYKLFRWK